MNDMKLEDLLKDTDALTYVNALKVTLMEVKDEVSNVEEMTGYINESVGRIRKLVRKADGQYRLITKLVHRDPPLTSNITIRDVTEEPDDEIRELMEDT